VSLPSYRDRNSPRGNELLQYFLDKAKTSFRTDFRPGNQASFENTRFSLNLAKHIVLVERLASLTDLLQFFCVSMIGKMTLQKISPDGQVSVISDTADILAACHEDVRCRTSAQFSSLQRQVTDACPILLEVSYPFPHYLPYGIMLSSNPGSVRSQHVTYQVLECMQSFAASMFTGEPRTLDHRRRT